MECIIHIYLPILVSKSVFHLVNGTLTRVTQVRNRGVILSLFFPSPLIPSWPPSPVMNTLSYLRGHYYILHLQGHQQNSVLTFFVGH